MLSYVFFLTSFCSLVRFIICSLPSGLDILAEVASNKPHIPVYLSESLKLSADQEAVLAKLVKSKDFEQKLEDLQCQSTNYANYLSLLFRLLEKIPENNFSEYVKICKVARDFAKVSYRLDSSVELFDYRKLSRSKIKALGIESVNCSNYSLFKFLVHTDLLDLNDKFNHKSSAGNAVVFVHGDVEFFKFSLQRGLNLHSSVIVNNRKMSSIAFLALHANPEIIDISQKWLSLCQAEAATKRPSESSSSGAKRQKRAKSSTKFVPLSSISPPSDDVGQHEWEIIGQSMPGDSSRAEIEWSQLRQYKPNAPGYLTQEHYIIHLRNRLSEEGPVRMAKFVSEYPVFLQRHDFLQMVRNVLKGDPAMIAIVYGGNIKTTAELLPGLKKKFDNDELYTDFVLELLKYCSNQFDVIAYYTELVSSESPEFFADHDYSCLPVNILVQMVNYAVWNDAFALVDKLFAYNRAGFEAKMLTDVYYLRDLYSGVQSAAMLRKLLQLGVPPTSILENGCPFVFYFLMNRDSEYVAVLKESNLITKALVTESFNYCLENFQDPSVIQKLTDILNEKSTLR